MLETYPESEPTMSECLAMDAQDKGADAYVNGWTLDENPYPDGSRLRTAWSDGWLTEQGNSETA